MAIPEDKKARMIADGLKPEALEALEKMNSSESKEAKAEGVIQKDNVPVEIPKIEQPASLDTITSAITMLVDAVVALKPLADEVKSLKTEIEQLKKDDEAKIAEKAMNVPRASLEAMVQEKLFGPATQVDGRSALVKSGPKVTEEQKPQGLFFEQWLPGNQQAEVRR